MKPNNVLLFTSLLTLLNLSLATPTSNKDYDNDIIEKRQPIWEKIRNPFSWKTEPAVKEDTTIAASSGSNGLVSDKDSSKIQQAGSEGTGSVEAEKKIPEAEEIINNGKGSRHLVDGLGNIVFIASGLRLIAVFVEEHYSLAISGSLTNTVSYASTVTSTGVITNPCEIATLQGIPYTYIHSASEACQLKSYYSKVVARTITNVGTTYTPVTYVYSTSIPQQTSTS